MFEKRSRCLALILAALTGVPAARAESDSATGAVADSAARARALSEGWPDTPVGMVASGWVEAFGEEHDLPRSIVNDLNVALDEVLNNIISYAYTDAADHPIAVELAFDGVEVTAVVTDDGVPFDPLLAPGPTLEPDLKKRRVGGVGIHFVRSLMDRYGYSRTNGRNVLTLTKHVA